MESTLNDGIKTLSFERNVDARMDTHATKLQKKISPRIVQKRFQTHIEVYLQSMRIHSTAQLIQRAQTKRTIWQTATTMYSQSITTRKRMQKCKRGSKAFIPLNSQKIHRNVGFESILAFVNLAVMELDATISKRLGSNQNARVSD